MTAKAISHILVRSYADAETALNEALTIDGNYADALAARVTLAELSGKRDDVESHIRQASCHALLPILTAAPQLAVDCDRPTQTTL